MATGWLQGSSLRLAILSWKMESADTSSWRGRYMTLPGRRSWKAGLLLGAGEGGLETRFALQLPCHAGEERQVLGGEELVEEEEIDSLLSEPLRVFRHDRESEAGVFGFWFSLQLERPVGWSTQGMAKPVCAILKSGNRSRLWGFGEMERWAMM